MALAVAWMLNQAKGTSDHTITCSSCMKLMIGQYLAHILQDSIPQPRKTYFDIANRFQSALWALTQSGGYLQNVA